MRDLAYRAVDLVLLCSQIIEDAGLCICNDHKGQAEYGCDSESHFEFLPTQPASQSAYDKMPIVVLT